MRTILRRLSRPLLLAGGLALLAGSLGCGSPHHLVAQRAEVFTPGAARVTLLGVSGNLISIDVFNQTSYPLVVYRDSFVLSTSTGMRARLPGGVGNVYNIRPGGVHQVKLRFDLGGLHRGEQAALIVQNALVVNGQPLPVEPLPFVVQ